MSVQIKIKCDGCGAITTADVSNPPSEADLAWRKFTVDWSITRFGGKSEEHIALHACSDDCARKVLADLPLVRRSRT